MRVQRFLHQTGCNRHSTCCTGFSEGNQLDMLLQGALPGRDKAGAPSAGPASSSLPAHVASELQTPAQLCAAALGEAHRRVQSTSGNAPAGNSHLKSRSRSRRASKSNIRGSSVAEPINVKSTSPIADLNRSSDLRGVEFPDLLIFMPTDVPTCDRLVQTPEVSSFTMASSHETCCLFACILPNACTVNEQSWLQTSLRATSMWE